MTERSPWTWYVPKLEEKTVERLQRELGLSRLAAACLARLGFSSAESAAAFLGAGLFDLADPFLLSGARSAADRLATAVKNREGVLVWGDYDVDGVTALAMLTACLRHLGLPVDYHIPGRLDEGYGLHTGPLEDWAKRGGRLVITVDCGINSFAEMARAAELGLDLIITDHHQPFAGERPALAVLNPKMPGCSYPEKNLSGAGVAWTLLRALYRKLGLPVEEAFCWLDLVALGTIADVVPLLGENRIIVRHGLERLGSSPSPGMLALARQAGLSGTLLSADQVAYMLVPRLNAPGRLGDAGPAVRLLLAQGEEAWEAAAKLEEANRRRQQIEAEVLAQAREQAATQAHEPALVLWHEEWHPGVIGIVAGRLAAEYQRPVLLVAVQGEEGQGSARATPGHDLVARLADCACHLLRFGGHREAAGLAVQKVRLPALRADFCRSIARHPVPGEMQQPVVASVRLDELTPGLLSELARLAPFGAGNPEPYFLAESLGVVSARPVGNQGEHLRLCVQDGGSTAGAIYFGAACREQPLKGDTVDLVFRPRENTWQGQTSVELLVRDLRVLKETGSLPVVADRRGLPGRDRQLCNLAARERLVVFVNTQAAKERLLGCLKAATVVRRGEQPPPQDLDAAVFYHLPYDRRATEDFLASLRFRGRPRFHLFYGQEDLTLNEKIFSASVPCAAALREAAAALEKAPHRRLGLEQLQPCFTFPVTRSFLERIILVLEELGDIPREGLDEHLNRSATYLESRRILDAFRRYQRFWLAADARELANYLSQPRGFTLPEEETYEAGRIKRAN